MRTSGTKYIIVIVIIVIILIVIIISGILIIIVISISNFSRVSRRKAVVQLKIQHGSRSYLACSYAEFRKTVV